MMRRQILAAAIGLIDLRPCYENGVVFAHIAGILFGLIKCWLAPHNPVRIILTEIKDFAA